MLDCLSRRISSPDTCGAGASNILSLFDVNHDYRITADELRANNLINAVLQADLDLFGANGSPGHDGVKDAVSLGLGFTAKSAIFDVAAER